MGMQITVKDKNDAVKAFGHTTTENKSAVQEAIDACPVQAISWDD